MELWHNPRCSKSRQALALLEDAGHAPTVRLYLEEPPTEARLREVVRWLGMAPREMMRRGEAVYKELGLSAADDNTLFAAMAAHPILIERPILITGTKAAIGRPPEEVLGVV